ncbi:hypothetical protein BDR05DRAFT_1006837 [Suillus weaverae]|nr:hypothetical protein BDR05DRAFT_1006837 [Suillus weaverae]
MEQTIINAYRIGLLDDSSGGAAAIRFAIEDNTENYRVARPISRKKQKQKGRGLEGIEKVTQLAPEHVNLTWPDQIDVAAVSQVDFKLEVELGSQKRDLLLVHQTRQAQNIIDLVQRSRIAWEDITGVAEARERPPLRPEVQGALEALIKELSINAHHQRQSLKGRKFPFDGSISPSDHLHVLYRAAENETAVSRIMRNKKFLVPSQGDELALLEAEARTRQRHRERAREHDKKEELLDAKKGPDGNSARSAPVQSDMENQAGTKTHCLPAPMQCSAAMTTTAEDLCVHPAYPPLAHPSVQHDACMDAGGMGPTLDVDPTLDANPTLNAGLTPDSDPTPSSPIINVNPAPPHPTQAPTTHVPARSDSAIGESEDNALTIEDGDIESAAKSDDAVGSNLASNCAFHKEQGKPTPRPRPIYRRGEVAGRRTEGHRLTKDVAPTLKKRQASHSVSSTDSYGGHTANGKPDRKRRQLGEDNAGLPGNIHFQFQEDDDTIFSQLA